ncbi:transcriptional regulator [Dehalobacter sp. MCB1]|uniref:helix-turn-helix domain-containing protein n=1 Tax=unclassified Dehalobacter TaxID=2635733 RepID=UPI000E6D39B7|nr:MULTISPECIES: helix-turn-helix transcriptional regulator [unclassified Dehalobacter]RJE48823.1 transcriptional regulator [Dehalobacter sp. MCB1]TCX53058.1 XRE family transcriptional regulator [Dehalobacter sp. 12DCB1]
MAVGDRIKRIRNLRGLTQKELGLAISFDDKTADVRIAQYESGIRTPKEDMLKEIAEVLDVNYRSIYEPSLYAAEDVMYTLFELDEHYPINLHDIEDNSAPKSPAKHIAIDFNSHLLNEFLTEWQQRKKDLADGIISKAEYMEWKLNWPQTCDEGAMKEPTKKWRKS